MDALKVKKKAKSKEVVFTEDDLNAIAMYALVTGLNPDRQKKIEACDCDNCAAAAKVLRLVGDRMRLILEAEHATKN
jgi:hypothetical protein